MRKNTKIFSSCACLARFVSIALIAILSEGCSKDSSSSPDGFVKVSATVTGLQGSGLKLAKNQNDVLEIDRDGTYTFAKPLKNGVDYYVSVRQKPLAPSQTCSIVNGDGVVPDHDIAVDIRCTTDTFEIRALVQVVPEKTVTVQLKRNGADVGAPRTFSDNGTFALGEIMSGSRYEVVIYTRGASNEATNCGVYQGSGRVDDQAVTDVQVICGGRLEWFAGDMSGSGNIDGKGSLARFRWPSDVAVDMHGNVYVADTENNIIRKITPAGVVTTIAGMAGQLGSTDGVGSAARFRLPNGVAVDVNGNVYVAESYYQVLRKISADGTVTTLAGKVGLRGNVDGVGDAARFNGPIRMATDAGGNVFVSDNHAIRKVTPDGVVSTIAGNAALGGSTNGEGLSARFNNPRGVAVDAQGNIFVADSGNRVIRKIDTTGVVTTFAGAVGQAASVDGPSNVARFQDLVGIALDGKGNIFVTDNLAVRKIAADGTVMTLAGEAGIAGSIDAKGYSARFSTSNGIAVDKNGNVYVADSRNSTIRKISASGVVSTLAGLSMSWDSLDGPAKLMYADGIAADSNGNLLVTDNRNNVIRKITPNGVDSIFAGAYGQIGSADGIGDAARFVYPEGIATDSMGNIFVADYGDNTIRKISAEGMVTTWAGTAKASGGLNGAANVALFYLPSDVVTDTDGNVYVADRGNHTIRKISADGLVSLLAGRYGSSGSEDGIGTAARFNTPAAVALDAGGNIYVADYWNYTIRKITANGTVTTLAGVAGQSGSADGLKDAARFSGPSDLDVDANGNVYVADFGNHVIRKITPDGMVSTVVGKAGSIGFMPGALPGALSSPQGITIVGTTMYITTYHGVAVVYGLP